MVSRSQLAGLPAVVGVDDPQVASILTAMRERLAYAAQTSDLQAIESRLNTVSAATGDTGDTGARPLAPGHLQASGIFGGAIVQVDAIPRHAAYVEWLAAPEDDIGQQQVIGMTTVPMFIHYTGNDTGRYYWARGVGYGQNPLIGPLNQTAGTYARSASDPALPMAALSKSVWQASASYASFDAVIPTGNPVVLGGIVAAFRAENAGQSGANEPNWATVTEIGGAVQDNNIVWRAVDANNAPLLVIDGRTFIDTALIRAATIKSAMIESLAANKIVANDLAAISATMGLVTGGTFRTAASGERVEISSSGAYPIWVGSGAKNNANAIFYVDENGNARFRGAVEIGYGDVSGPKPPTDWIKPGTTRIDGNQIYTGDAYVDTLQIKGDAVTLSLFSSTSSSRSYGYPYSWRTVEQIAVVAWPSDGNTFAGVAFGYRRSGKADGDLNSDAPPSSEPSPVYYRVLVGGANITGSVVVATGVWFYYRTTESGNTTTSHYRYLISGTSSDLVDLSGQDLNGKTVSLQVYGASIVYRSAIQLTVYKR